PSRNRPADPAMMTTMRKRKNPAVDVLAMRTTKTRKSDRDAVAAKIKARESGLFHIRSVNHV
ncbi:hypothetical protein, partial [Escherichia coli]|uniref:hypothetical protein n=1 Tax=Escherichia coli TaxID=562 RepID=UPI001F2C24E0